MRSAPSQAARHTIADTLRYRWGLVGPPWEETPIPPACQALYERHSNTTLLLPSPLGPLQGPSPQRTQPPEPPPTSSFTKSHPTPPARSPRKPSHLIRRVPCGKRRERAQRSGPQQGRAKQGRPPPPPPPNRRHVGPGHSLPASSSAPPRPPPIAGSAGWRHPPLSPGKGQGRAAAARRADGGGWRPGPAAAELTHGAALAQRGGAEPHGAAWRGELSRGSDVTAAAPRGARRCLGDAAAVRGDGGGRRRPVSSVGPCQRRGCSTGAPAGPGSGPRPREGRERCREFDCRRSGPPVPRVTSPTPPGWARGWARGRHPVAGPDGGSSPPPPPPLPELPVPARKVH